MDRWTNGVRMFGAKGNRNGAVAGGKGSGVNTRVCF